MHSHILQFHCPKSAKMWQAYYPKYPTGDWVWCSARQLWLTGNAGRCQCPGERQCVGPLEGKMQEGIEGTVGLGDDQQHHSINLTGSRCVKGVSKVSSCQSEDCPYGGRYRTNLNVVVARQLHELPSIFVWDVSKVMEWSPSELLFPNKSRALTLIWAFVLLRLAPPAWNTSMFMVDKLLVALSIHCCATEFPPISGRIWGFGRIWEDLRIRSVVMTC